MRKYYHGKNQIVRIDCIKDYHIEVKRKFSNWNNIRALTFTDFHNGREITSGYVVYTPDFKSASRFHSMKKALDYCKLRF